MLCHLGLFLFGYLYVPLLATSFWLHTLLIGCVLSSQIFNGATFYIDYFAKHYEAELAVIEQMNKSQDQEEEAL